MTLLPPNASHFERAVESNHALLADVPVALRNLWNPQTCPAQILPWLAWGVSIDFWDSAWAEQEKRDAIADAIVQQRRKGTRASLRTVLDRFDPLIELVEWFQDPLNMEPHTFRLELPGPMETAVVYDEALVTALLRDIAAVKPLRSHMQAVHRLRGQAHVGLVSPASVAMFGRLDAAADAATAADPAWQNYLQTEDGEPIEDEAGNPLEVA